MWSGLLLISGGLLWGGRANSRLAGRPLESRLHEVIERSRQWLSDHWRRREAEARRRRGAAEFVLALSDELSTGLPLETAVIHAGQDFPWCARTVRAARVGGDVVEALRIDADEANVTVLRALGAAWQVAAGSGAGLAVAARNIGQAAMERERVRRELASEMAGPRSTARVLAALPLVGLLLGSGIGGSPWAWLTATPVGWVVLVVGISLEVVGLLWVRWLVRRVERQL